MSEIPVESHTLRLKVWGENACFTRPEMKVERVSYDVITPSAARGVLEAILWKPAIQWRVIQIDVLKPIRWESVRRNEVGAVMSTDLVLTAMGRGRGQLGMYVEDQRQQRAGLFLRDVAYTVHAFFEMTANAGTDDNVTKFEQMFRRRAEKGQCFHRPYLGCREFAANFAPIGDDLPLPTPISQTGDLGWMLHDQDYGWENPMPRFFRAKLEGGCLRIPPLEAREVRA